MTPKILNVYQKEYERKQQEEVDMMDYSAWLHGLYVKSAIAVFVNKHNQYPEEPLYKANIHDRQENVSADKRAALDFENWAMAFNASREKGGEVSGG